MNILALTSVTELLPNFYVTLLFISGILNFSLSQIDEYNKIPLAGIATNLSLFLLPVDWTNLLLTKPQLSNALLLANLHP